jgi:hypothetical protein
MEYSRALATIEMSEQCVALLFFGRGSGRIPSPAQRERQPTEGRRVRVSPHVAQTPCSKPCLSSSGTLGAPVRGSAERERASAPLPSPLPAFAGRGNLTVYGRRIPWISRRSGTVRISRGDREPTSASLGR